MIFDTSYFYRIFFPCFNNSDICSFFPVFYCPVSPLTFLSILLKFIIETSDYSINMRKNS